MASDGGMRWKARTRSGEDEEEEILSEQFGNSLSLGSKSPEPFRRRDGSVHSDEGDDAADGAISDLVSDTGGSLTQKSHAYQASISSDEGNQLAGQTKRTFRPHRREFARQPGFAGQMWPPGGGRRDTSGDSSSFPSWNSNSRHKDSDPFSVSHWTESDGMSSDYRVSPPVRPSSAFEEPDMSKRMDGIREQQRMKAHLQNTGGMRRSFPESDRSSQSSWSGGLDGRGRRPVQTQHCCLHCRSDICAAYSLFPSGNCCDDGRCRNCSHFCCHPSTASVVGCHGNPGPHRPRRRELSYAEMPTGSEDRQPRKSQVQPVFGGTGFVMCYECFVLIQLPPNFTFTVHRRNKLQCGACRKVVVFLLAERNHIVPATTTSLPSNVSLASSSHSERRAPEEEYSSTEYETDSTEAAKGKKKGNPSALHKLVGYFSAKPKTREERRRG